MKANKILWFYALVVAALAVLCLVFPKEGIPLGKSVLRFPTMHHVLTRGNDSVPDVVIEEVERDLSGARDSLRYFRETLTEGEKRFWLPNDDLSFFDNFFRAAEQARTEGRVVRVLHYGDSQIEMDRITMQLRERLQEVFGGGGPGMIPLRQPIPTYSFSQNASGNLHGQSTYGDSTMRRANGNYGPMLRSWRVEGSARITMRATNNKEAREGVKHFSSIRVLFNNRPGPMAITMQDKNGGGSYQETVQADGIHVVAWTMDSATQSATVSLQGTADVYGLMVDNGYGVAVDNISMRGVSGHQFAQANANQLKEAYALMDVGVIIMQFGGNSMPYLKGDKSINTYCEAMGKQIDILHEACPQAAILFVGPSDMSTKVGGQLASYPQLEKVVARLQEVVNAHGAAFWSIYDAMGGHNSMIAWHNQGLAGADYVHFSTKGARLMGDYLSESFLRMYGLYQLRQALTDEQFERLWKEACNETKTEQP